MIRIACLLTCLLTCIGAATTVSTDLLPLADGDEATAVTLDNGLISCRIVPALGGKIISLRNADGLEFLSRSERPYRSRSSDPRPTDFGTTAFDGIDECFPTVAAATYPNQPWAGVEIDGHGECWNQAWEVRDQTDGLTIAATGRALPYTLERRATLDGRRLVLDYRLHNRGPAPIAWHYAFHPLLAASTGAAIELPDAIPTRVLYSKQACIGAKGSQQTWGELRAAAFADGQFTTDADRWYKYVAGPFTTGEVGFRHAAGQRLTLRWSAEIMPYLAVWVSEGGIGGLHHIGPEPTVSWQDSLEQVIAAQQHQSLAAGDTCQWQISLELEEGAP